MLISKFTMIRVKCPKMNTSYLATLQIAIKTKLYFFRKYFTMNIRYFYSIPHIKLNKSSLILLKCLILKYRHINLFISLSETEIIKIYLHVPIKKPTNYLIFERNHNRSTSYLKIVLN